MKHFFPLTGALLLTFSTLIAQNITYKIGDEYETTERHKDLGYFFTSGNIPANVSFIRELEFSIQPVNLSTLNVSSGKSIDISSLGENRIFEKVINLKDNLFYIYSFINKSNKTRAVAAKLIDETNTSVTNKNPMLFESEEPKVAYLKPMTPTRYNFAQSTNKEFGLISYILPSRKSKAKENKDVLGFNLFDKNLSKKWAKEVEMPYTEQIMSIMDYHVTSKGEVFMLIRVFDENHLGKWNTMLEHARYELVKISGDAELQKKEINLNGKFFKNAMLTDDLDGNLVAVGYYGNSFESGSGANGMYIFKFGTEAKNADLMFYDFTIEMLKSYENPENQESLENGAKLDASLYLDNVFFHPNGDMLIVNEQYKSVATGNGSKNYFLDIVALKTNRDGKLVWIKKIPKNQTGASRADLSYKYHYCNGNDYFIFIDNENNLALALNQEPKAHISRLGGYLVAVKMDKEGNMQKIPIFDLRAENVNVFPLGMFKVNDDMLIGKCLKAGKKRMLQINFK